MKFKANNGQTLIARDDIQASAFINAGLERVGGNGGDDIETLKAQATELGIEFSPNIGAKTLKERIDQFNK